MAVAALASIKSITYTVVGAADGRTDGSSPANGRIAGYSIDTIFGANGTDLVTGAKLANAASYRLQVDSSNLNPFTRETLVEHNDGPGLITLTAISQVPGLVRSASCNPLGDGNLKGAYSFASAAATPARMLHAEGLTVDGVVQTELPATGSQVYRPVVQVGLTDGSTLASKKQLKVYSLGILSMSTIYPNDWREYHDSKYRPVCGIVLIY